MLLFDDITSVIIHHKSLEIISSENFQYSSLCLTADRKNRSH